MDQVVKDTSLRIEISDAPPPIDLSVLSVLESGSAPSEPEHAAGPQSRKASEEPPRDYWFELGMLTTLQPNHEILFSIPINQLRSNWHIQIPFEFEVPKGKVPRDPKVGGLPEMYVSYSRYDLPDDVRAKIYGQARE
jgi:hypothetical protein